jgi:hypothetical protein
MVKWSVLLLYLVLALSVARLPVPVRATPVTAPGQADEAPARSVIGRGDAAAVSASTVFTTYVYLPLIIRSEPCLPVPGERYNVLSVDPPPTDRPAELHADLNLSLRGYVLTTAFLGLVDYSGAADPGAPQLPGLFADNRTATFSAAYRVYDWNWACNCRGPAITELEVTLAGLAVSPGETIHVPDSGYSIGSGFEVLVLYASRNRITLKYTRDDNVVRGYTLHVEGICVEPYLLALYQTWNDAGRGHLPALRAGQAFGRVRGNAISVAIRDNGTFQDPRSRKDWWHGR